MSVVDLAGPFAPGPTMMVTDFGSGPTPEAVDEAFRGARLTKKLRPDRRTIIGRRLWKWELETIRLSRAAGEFIAAPFPA